ncbi:class I SAM-dependent methyltransferase [Streptomyces specialis]|uniref:class I SAM-dependent methyltransferase n=1 Tax=Streptomyces specialis TaxID=498367 RepID=UPI00073F1016|nr:methyltransferase domain-containing protein [Streptomyces specialis]
MPLVPDPSAPVRLLDPAEPEYRHGLELFLAGTDEKALTHPFLSDLAAALPRRRVFLDIGAGEGRTTRYVSRFFERTVVIEPSEDMRRAVLRACPDARVIGTPIGATHLDVRADLALCSHVLYYVPRPDWLSTTLRMLSWVAPGGELVLMLQNPGNDTMRMVRHFTGTHFDLADLEAELLRSGDDMVADTVMTTLRTRFRTDVPADALTVAEFLLNDPSLRRMEPRPTRGDLERYVVTRFTEPTGALSWSCSHDILRVRRAPAAR